MEFKSDVLKTTIVLKEDKVCIEIKGIFDKLGGLKNVEFKYEKINSIEIFEPKGFSLTVPNLTFKVDGQEFKGNDNLNPYKVQYSAKKKEEARKIREKSLGVYIYTQHGCTVPPVPPHRKLHRHN